MAVGLRSWSSNWSVRPERAVAGDASDVVVGEHDALA
jgi:hypothetical protein